VWTDTEKSDEKKYKEKSASGLCLCVLVSSCVRVVLLFSISSVNYNFYI